MDREATQNTTATETGATGSDTKYDKLIAATKAIPPVPTVVVHLCDETSLRGAVDSTGAGIIQPIRVGPKAKISHTASKYDGAGVVLGARVPIVLTSRADSARARMASWAVAALHADGRRRIASLAAA